MKDSVEAPRRANRRARPSKLKSVTFTGCWTCRSRKIKCDERQKNGCSACERSGLDCAGYGVNLCWVTGDKKQQDVQGLRRRSIKPYQSSSPSLSEDEISRILSTLDSVSTPLNTFSLGPFAIFSSRGTDKPEDCDYQSYSSLTPSGNSEASQPSRDDDTVCDADAEMLDTNLQSQQEDCVVRTDNERSYTSLIHDLETSNEGNLIALRSQTNPPGSESLEIDLLSSWNPSQHLDDGGTSSSLMVQSPPPSPHSGISMPLFQDPQTSTLMYHYMDHVADLLQPVLHPMNPWRTTYFPFALEGCPELFLSQSSSPSSYASIALFHSLLSSAAFHLRNVTGDSKKFHKLGLQHRAKSLHALNAALTRPNDSQLYTVYLTAMLSLVTIDTITGEDSDFPIHLKACRQLQKPPPGTMNDTSRPVDTICHFLSLLARTTSLKLEPPPEPTDSTRILDQAPHFNSDERSIEHIYGITPKLGNLLERTCQIAEYGTIYQGKHVPTAFLKASEELKIELCAWDIDSEPFYSIGPEHGTMLEIARCQARAFHSAVLIFYYRTIEHYTEINLEEEVSFIWKNLTTAEDLKDDFMHGEKRAAPMSWPAFIASCEATDREAWAEWWTRVQGYRVGNFMKQWLVIQRLWNIMDTDETSKSWVDALKRSGELILPI